MTKHYTDEDTARADRDAKLAASDWTQAADVENRITHLCVENYRRYRSQVYEAKHQPGWPLEVDWPDEPAIQRQEDMVSIPMEPVE